MQHRKYKYPPQLVSVDPNMIKFSPFNPRRHRGMEYFRLRRNISDFGIVQLPSVRVLPGGFYECIDGEGRVRFAQEEPLDSILVVSFGLIDDQEALSMLQSANAVRSFDLLAECRGLSELHRQGMNMRALAEKFSISESTIEAMVNIGYFPQNIHLLIENDIERSDEHAKRWTLSLLDEVLPLRQERGLQLPSFVEANQTKVIDETFYNYTEVRRALEKVVQGDITSTLQMAAYVAKRRLEIFEERFNQNLKTQLDQSINSMKAALEDAHSQQVEHAKEEATQEYKDKLTDLQKRLEDLEKQNRTLINDVAKRPEIVEKKSKELEEKIKIANKKREEIEDEKMRLKEQEERFIDIIQKQNEDNLKLKEEEQRKKLSLEFEKARLDIKTNYDFKIQQHEMKVENTVKQAVSHGIEVLAEVEQSLLLFMNPDFLRELSWMQGPEKVSLLAQMRVVRQTLEDAEEKLLHGGIIFASPAESDVHHGTSTQ